MNNNHYTETRSYTTKEASEYLGITGQEIYLARSAGELGGTRDGRSLIFTQDELDAYKRLYLQQPANNIDISATEVQQKNDELPAVEEVDTPAEDEESPTCHRCYRLLLTPQEYVVKKFVEDGKPVWYPVCRDGRCEPEQQTQVSKLLQELKDIRSHIDRVISEYEQEK